MLPEMMILIIIIITQMQASTYRESEEEYELEGKLPELFEE